MRKPARARQVFAPEKMPWMFPVPVKKGNFESIFPEHQVYNVQADASGISPYKANLKTQSAEELLWCDTQTYCLGSVQGRLGAGRSGVYRGKYLKGIGRTPLAGNWRESKDVYHNSGHLLASAAIREFIVSSYLSAVKMDESIIPCEGLLFRPLDKALREYSFTPRFALWPVDRALQAISVKPFRHIRASNLIWQINHLSPKNQNSLGNFILCLARYLAFSQEIPFNLTQLDPTTLVQRFVEVTEESILHFTNYFRGGVHWLSYANNLTLSGQMLDLEVPLILGGPAFVGICEFTKSTLPASRLAFFGTELTHYAREMRAFCSYLGHSLRYLEDFNPGFNKTQVAYLKAFRRSWSEKFQKDRCWFLSTKKIESILMKLYENHLPLDLVSKKRLTSFLRSLLSSRLEGKPGFPEIDFRLIRKVSRMYPEPGHPYLLYESPFLACGNDIPEKTLYFEEMFRQLYAIQDLPKLMSACLEADKKIRRDFGSKRRTGNFSGEVERDRKAA